MAQRNKVFICEQSPPLQGLDNGLGLSKNQAFNIIFNLRSLFLR